MPACAGIHLLKITRKWTPISGSDASLLPEF
jgi:hypothetical protein